MHYSRTILRDMDSSLEDMSQLVVPAAQRVVIDDSIPGIEAARREGMRGIAFTTTNPPAALT